MKRASYTAAQAAADLAANGLLHGVLAADGGVLKVAEADRAPGEFVGAGLDSRALAPEALFVALAGERADGRTFAPAALAAGHWVLTRSLTAAAQDPLLGTAAAPEAGVLLCDEPVAALACLGKTWRGRLDPALVAVTGTNGKTTTKDLLAAMLGGVGPTHATGGNLNNQLGVPLTLLGLRPEHRYAVLELGASAVGEIAGLAGLVRPTVGVITNASPAHLAEFGGLDGVISGKGELVAALPADGTAVLNADSPGFADWCARSVAPVVSFGQTAGDHRWRWQPTAAGGELDLDGETWPVPLPGAHNAANLAAAVLAGRALDLTDTVLRRGLAEFAGSPHRGVVRDLDGRTFLDDAYNANPRSVVAAVGALLALPGTGRTVAVLGLMAELGPDSDDIHRTTGGELQAAGLQTLLTVGAGAEPLGEGFTAAGGPTEHCATPAAAATWLSAHTAPGDRILVKGSRSAAMERVLESFAARRGDH